MTKEHGARHEEEYEEILIGAGLVTTFCMTGNAAAIVLQLFGIHSLEDPVLNFITFCLAAIPLAASSVRNPS